jgi:SPX domain protein involved in polyphosphate accumulation
MNKIQQFTLDNVKQMRERTVRLETDTDDFLASSPSDTKRFQSLKAAADNLSKDFLRLEKYVNLNYMGFHKILKKHDKVFSTPPPSHLIWPRALLMYDPFQCTDDASWISM